MSAQEKLEEAKFFLELLQTLEEKGSALTSTATSDQEASFLFSAIVNALYSAVAMLEEAEVNLMHFRKEHAELYAIGKKGGARAVTVHKQHLRMAFSHTTPPFMEPAFSLRELPDGATQNRHYIVLPRDWSIVHALEFCHYHYCKLQDFMQRSGVLAQQPMLPRQRG